MEMICFIDPACFFGDECQFYTKGLGSTLDEILGYELKRNTILSKQFITRPQPPEQMGYFNIYIRETSQAGYRRPLQRIRIPAARYRRDRFPLRGPFITFRLLVPISVDPSTHQTIIYSRTGSIYILPSLINMYGRVFSLGKLIASGSASFVNTRIDMRRIANFDNYFRSELLVGPNMPRLDKMKGSFTGSIRTNYRSVSSSKPSKTPVYDQHRDSESTDEYNHQSSSSRKNYYTKRPRPSYKAYKTSTKQTSTTESVCPAICNCNRTTTGYLVITDPVTNDATVYYDPNGIVNYTDYGNGSTFTTAYLSNFSITAINVDTNNSIVNVTDAYGNLRTYYDNHVFFNLGCTGCTGTTYSSGSVVSDADACATNAPSNPSYPYTVPSNGVGIGAGFCPIDMGNGRICCCW
ncbi:unnamed protein product [Adineta steineri]|uniref:Uncharacterized protein n=1 Tax=Adineta steineri TaxID=433720 RepID=A0A814IEK3_9BILA|nr:unnamed protein product [Adineta steineri]